MFFKNSPSWIIFLTTWDRLHDLYAKWKLIDWVRAEGHFLCLCIAAIFSYHRFPALFWVIRVGKSSFLPKLGIILFFLFLIICKIGHILILFLVNSSNLITYAFHQHSIPLQSGPSLAGWQAFLKPHLHWGVTSWSPPRLQHISIKQSEDSFWD